MQDKTEKIASFREYFQEAKAREKSVTLREYTDRLLFEDTVRKTLDNLKEEGFSIQEGLFQISPWRKKIEGFEKPDFIVFKEDILFYLYLLVNEDRFIIKRDYLRGLSDVIQCNPKVTALIAIWNFDNLPSCALDPFILRKYIETTENIISLENEKISNLEKTVRDFYNEQFVDWPIPEEIVIGKEVQAVPFNISDMLQQYFDEKLKSLGEKYFIIPEKKEAQRLVVKISRSRILDKLISLLSKPTLTRDDFTEFESFLDKELKKAKGDDD